MASNLPEAAAWEAEDGWLTTETIALLDREILEANESYEEGQEVIRPVRLRVPLSVSDEEAEEIDEDNEEESRTEQDTAGQSYTAGSWTVVASRKYNIQRQQVGMLED